MSSTDLDQFYTLLALLKSHPNQGQKLLEYTGRSPLPTRGVYFFFEPGEHRSTQPDLPRVIRVGTHAVSTGSKSTLWSRLRAHRGGRDGGGNHRGSIFRLHVGTALLHRDRQVIGELATWGVGSTAKRPIRASEATHERRVSTYLGEMSILWVAIPDEPSPTSDRAYIERNAIALLSNQLQPSDPPSQNWLGLHSPRPEIRSSGLWNLNHVSQQYDPTFLKSFESFVTQTIAQ